MSCLKTARMKWHQILLTPFYSTETFSEFNQLFAKTEKRLLVSLLALIAEHAVWINTGLKKTVSSIKVL